MGIMGKIPCFRQPLIEAAVCRHPKRTIPVLVDIANPIVAQAFWIIEVMLKPCEALRLAVEAV